MPEKYIDPKSSFFPLVNSRPEDLMVWCAKDYLWSMAYYTKVSTDYSPVENSWISEELRKKLPSSPHFTEENSERLKEIVRLFKRDAA